MREFIKTTWRWAAIAALMLGATAWFASPARASSIDAELKQLAPQIVAHCQDKGWKSVGVLKFRVQVGKEKPSWHVGQMNSVMALCLENALIVFNDPAEPVHVTRNAGETAVKKLGAVDYLSEAGRKKLLGVAYPLAWGGKKEKVDAFLAGTVTISADFKETTVSLSVFDQKDPNLRPLSFAEGKPVCFTVATDRNILADMNRVFFLASREPLRTEKLDDAQFLELLKKQQAKKKKDDKLPFHEFLDFEVYYNGKPQKIVRDGDDFRLPTPKLKEVVHFAVKSRLKEPLGVVLLVNGINTFRKETLRLPDQYSNWILQEKGKEYLIGGYFPSEKKVEFFEVRPEEEAMYYPLADSTKLGKIEIHVFRQAEVETIRPDAQDSLRNDTGMAESLAELRKKILTATPPGQKGIILPSADPKKADVRLVSFNNPVHIGYVSITYFKSGEKGGK
jgi:hypothetical protein